MKGVYKLDLAILLISALVLIFVIGYVSPLVIAPEDGMKTRSSEILFSIEKADYLYVDDNYDFTTPDVYKIEDGLKLNLRPGKYFWKAKGLVESEVRTLTIDSEVNFELKDLGDGSYGVFNAGNVRLDVEVYNGTRLVDRKKIDVGGLTGVEGSKIVGGQDES